MCLEVDYLAVLFNDTHLFIHLVLVCHLVHIFSWVAMSMVAFRFAACAWSSRCLIDLEDMFRVPLALELAF